MCGGTRRENGSSNTRSRRTWKKNGKKTHTDEAGGDDDKADTGTETYSRVPLVVTLVIIVEEPDDLADFELDLERTDE